MVDKSKIERARHFATSAHESIDQRRKYTDEPYMVHPEAVMRIVATHIRHASLEMLMAALLHDVVEDTPITLDQIQEEFGLEVKELVFWLTDIATKQDGNRATRCHLNALHIGQAPSKAKTIKIADVIDNISSIVQNDADFARTYIQEKLNLLPYLKGGDEGLYQLLEKTLHTAQEELLQKHLSKGCLRV